MQRNIFKTPYRLSFVIAVLALMASSGGLFMETLYRDNTFIRAAWRGNDVVTLVAAVPAMLFALYRSRKGSARAHLLWLGSLGYMLYNYIFYLYGAAFNVFFLLYVALCSLSAFFRKT